MGWRDRPRRSAYGQHFQGPSIYNAGSFGLEDIMANYLKGTGWDTYYYQPRSAWASDFQSGERSWDSYPFASHAEHWMYTGESYGEEGDYAEGQDAICRNTAGNVVPCTQVGSNYTDNEQCFSGPCSHGGYADGVNTSIFHFGDYESIGLTGLSQDTFKRRVESGMADEFIDYGDFTSNLNHRMNNWDEDDGNQYHYYEEDLDNLREAMDWGSHSSISDLYNRFEEIERNQDDYDVNQETFDFVRNQFENPDFLNLRDMGLDPAEYMTMKTADYFSAYDDTAEKDIRAERLSSYGDIAREEAVSSYKLKRSRGGKNVLASQDEDYERMKEIVQIKENINRHTANEDIRGLRDQWLTGVYNTIGNLASGADPESAGIFNQSYFASNQLPWEDWDDREEWYGGMGGQWYDEYT